MIRTTFFAAQSMDESWLFIIIKIKSNEMGR